MAFVNPLAPRKKDRSPNAATIKTWVRAYLQLSDDVVVTVSEAACADAGCPDIETVIGLFDPARPVHPMRIGKPVDRIDQSDILAALLFAGYAVPAPSLFGGEARK